MKSNQAGFTLVEILIGIAVLMAVSATVFDGVFRMTKMNGVIANRSEMHAGVRNATELLQQEVGQAGRITIPGTATLGADVAVGSATVLVKINGTNSVDGLYTNEQLVIDTGEKEETVTLTDVNTANHTISASFTLAHLSGASVQVRGGFQAGIVPASTTHGSTGTKLKIFGDINGDGRMVLVEYKCDTGAGYLYRNSMAWDTASGSKPSLTASKVLLNNLTANPDGTDCFTYQTQTVGTKVYVIDVAITLTVQTPDKDPVTNEYQTETKALLNVSPRNVFNTWELVSIGLGNRVQDTPSSITSLIAVEQ